MSDFSVIPLDILKEELVQENPGQKFPHEVRQAMIEQAREALKHPNDKSPTGFPCCSNSMQKSNRVTILHITDSLAAVPAICSGLHTSRCLFFGEKGYANKDFDQWQGVCPKQDTVFQTGHRGMSQTVHPPMSRMGHHINKERNTKDILRFPWRTQFVSVNHDSPHWVTGRNVKLNKFKPNVI